MASARGEMHVGHWSRMAIFGITVAVFGGGTMGCLQVPKSSVELSTTVGRDIETAREAHRNLAKALFSRMKRDVNRFVDEVYAPHQIQVVLAGQKNRQAKGDTNNLFSALDGALTRPADAHAQTDLMDMTQMLVESVRDDIEAFRADRMKGILQQETEVMAAIDGTYDQILRGNAVVTAHLASIVKVNEVQDDLLKRMGANDLRELVGVKLSETSVKLGQFVDKAKRVEGQIDEASPKVEKLTKELDSLLKRGQ